MIIELIICKVNHTSYVAYSAIELTILVALGIEKATITAFDAKYLALIFLRFALLCMLCEASLLFSLNWLHTTVECHFCSSIYTCMSGC